MTAIGGGDTVASANAIRRPRRHRFRQHRGRSTHPVRERPVAAAVRGLPHLVTHLIRNNPGGAASGGSVPFVEEYA